jgi:hypothetical protein
MHLGTQENSLCSSGSVGLGCCEYLWKSWWVEVGLLVSGTDTHRDSRVLNKDKGNAKNTTLAQLLYDRKAHWSEIHCVNSTPMCLRVVLRLYMNPAR